jgi:hypothetical protein
MFSQSFLKPSKKCSDLSWDGSVSGGQITFRPAEQNQSITLREWQG